MIYLITYDHPHRKTQDLLYQFKIAGVDLHVLAMPWIERKNFAPLFKIKPDDHPWYPEIICRKLGYTFDKILSDDDTKITGQVVAIGGAGILSKNFVETNTVINAHCGYLPEVRGLDALKWAIYYDQSIGVTTHVVDETCDGGKLIERKEVPLYPQDNLFSIAMRQYEMEINMMIDAIALEKYKYASDFGGPKYDPGRRMPHRKELQMIERLKRRLSDLSG